MDTKSFSIKLVSFHANSNDCKNKENQRLEGQNVETMHDLTLNEQLKH